MRKVEGEGRDASPNLSQFVIGSVGQLQSVRFVLCGCRKPIALRFSFVNRNHVTLGAKFSADLAMDQVDETYTRHSEP